MHDADALTNRTASRLAEQADPNAARPAALAGWAAFALTGLAVAVRLWRLRQSLWCDEMDTLLGYVSAPWRVVVAAGPGQYLPNDHVFYSVLAKLCLIVGNGGRMDPPARAAVLIRLPSLVAGSLLPVAIGWPLRRTAPAVALLLAAVAAVHPWLVAESDEARGYAVMLLFGVLATHRLPSGGRRYWPVGYGLLAAAAVYTVLVAGLIVAAHGCVVIVRRRGVGNWVRGLVIATAVAGALYLPVVPGILDYQRHPQAGPTNYADFTNQLFRFALAGRYLPATYGPERHVPDFWVGFGYWLAPVALLVAGTAVVARRQQALGPLLSVMAAATGIGLVLPIVVPTAVQVRFVPWCGLWLAVAVAGLVVEAGRRLGRGAGWAAGLAVVGWMAAVDLRMPPDQPVREAIRDADRVAPAGSAVVVAFLSADASVRFYGTGPRPIHAAATPADLPPAEAAARRWTGHRPWLVISFEFLIHDLRPDVWSYLNDHYRLVERLPGRVSPVAVYAPR